MYPASFTPTKAAIAAHKDHGPIVGPQPALKSRRDDMRYGQR
jgi:hypothetical protein